MPSTRTSVIQSVPVVAVTRPLVGADLQSAAPD